MDVARAVPAANLIKSSHQLLDTVVDQIALCESTARLSSIAADLARRLIAQERLSYHEILPLFGRIFDEVQGVSRLNRLTPVPGLSLRSIAASSTGDGDSVFFVEGLIAARVLVWTLNGEPRAAERLPQFVLAALLQDVGRMLESRSGSQKRRLSVKRIEWFKRNHPSIGAALLGAIRGAPVGLALMVGQHHERLDGRGFPRALMARDILPEAAVLAAASRFAGMCLEFDAEPFSEIADDNLPARIAQALLSEAEGGCWQIEFARHLSQQVTETEPVDAAVPANVPLVQAARPAEHDEFAWRRTNAGKRTLHDEEQTLRGTHAEPEGRFVATTLDEIKMLSSRGPGRFRGGQ